MKWNQHVALWQWRGLLSELAFILHFGFAVLLPSFNINIVCNKLYTSDSSQLWMLENVLFCCLCNCMRCLPVCCIWVAALYTGNKSPQLFVAYFVLSPNKRCCQKGLNQLVPFRIRRINDVSGVCIHSVWTHSVCCASVSRGSSCCPLWQSNQQK